MHNILEHVHKYPIHNIILYFFPWKSYFIETTTNFIDDLNGNLYNLNVFRNKTIFLIYRCIKF